MVSFNVEEAYVPPKDVVDTRPWFRKNGFFLKKGQYGEVWDKPITRVTFLSLLFTIVVVFVILFFVLHFFVLSFVGVVVSVGFFSWVSYQLLISARGLDRKEGIVFKPDIYVDGWYPDPWSNGVPNKERLFVNGKWADEVRFKLKNKYVSRVG